MALIERVRQLFDEQHEIMAWLTFALGVASIAFELLSGGWSVALIVVALITMRSLRAHEVGPAGIKFGSDCDG